MSKYRYLLKNIGLLTISSFATKLISFFLVPLYTNVLTTSDYGTYDLLTTSIGVLIPIFTLNVQDGVMRFAMDKNYTKDSIITIAFKYLIIGTIVVLTGVLLNNFFGFSIFLKTYSFFFVSMFFTQALSGIVLYYVRGVDRIADLSVSSIVASVVTIILNIVLLLVFKMGLLGYYLANILGPLVQCVYLIIRANIVRKIHNVNNYKREEKEIIKYSKPLIANSIAWWVNNVSDRYIVTFFCGIGVNGVYSVASKIPSILNIFQTIFTQAWTLSAVKDFDAEDKGGFFENTYRVYNCFLTIMCSVIILFDKVLAKLLYAKDFYQAWIYVPWLTIAILFGSLSGYIGGFYTAMKDSKEFARSTVYSAFTNIVLNLILVQYIGALGAAIATTVCYIEVWAIRLINSRKYIQFKINIVKHVISYVLLLLQAILVAFNKEQWLFLSLAICTLGVVLLYVKDIHMIVSGVKKRIEG